jgi:hypothetical protein
MLKKIKYILVEHRKEIILISAILMIYIFLMKIQAHAEELHPMPYDESPLHHDISVFGETQSNEIAGINNASLALIDPLSIPPEWIARVAIHELRINQLLSRDEIIRTILQSEPFQAFEAIYDEKIEFLELALTQRHLIAEQDITNLIDSTISFQEFLLLESIRQTLQNELTTENSIQEITMVSNLWILASNAIIAGLIIMAIIAVLWSRTS